MALSHKSYEVIFINNFLFIAEMWGDKRTSLLLNSIFWSTSWSGVGWNDTETPVVFRNGMASINFISIPKTWPFFHHLGGLFNVHRRKHLKSSCKKSDKDSIKVIKIRSLCEKKKSIKKLLDWISISMISHYRQSHISDESEDGDFMWAHLYIGN